mmetsp:Transcript_18182/g.47482  ORF Transcript_18182/g.47482 Transcript_18182/m.47482 type:complete len:238 (-) Transcript_18182:478-1191(-)
MEYQPKHVKLPLPLQSCDARRRPREDGAGRRQQEARLLMWRHRERREAQDRGGVERFTEGIPFASGSQKEQERPVEEGRVYNQVEPARVQAEPSQIFRRSVEEEVAPRRDDDGAIDRGEIEGVAQDEEPSAGRERREARRDGFRSTLGRRRNAVQAQRRGEGGEVKPPPADDRRRGAQRRAPTLGGEARAERQAERLVDVREGPRLEHEARPGRPAQRSRDADALVVEARRAPHLSE